MRENLNFRDPGYFFCKTVFGKYALFNIIAINRVVIFFNRDVALTSHCDYKDYRDTILSRPLVFFTNVKIKPDSPNGKYVVLFVIYITFPQIKTRAR